MSEHEWIVPSALPALVGTERFKGLDAQVQDFWKFSLGDLRMNNARGYLAEFLVARVLKIESTRVEWESYDLKLGEIRIEVKSSGYLQAWDQRQLSTIRFTGLRARQLDARLGLTDSKTFNADVYVFCVQGARTHAEYDPLDLGQWSFYVVGATAIVSLGQDSMGLTTVSRLSNGETRLQDLRRDVVSRAAES